MATSVSPSFWYVDRLIDSHDSRERVEAAWQRVVRAPDLKSGGRGFKSLTTKLKLFLGTPWFYSLATFVNNLSTS